MAGREFVNPAWAYATGSCWLRGEVFALICMARVRRVAQDRWLKLITAIGSRELTLTSGVQAGHLCDLLQNCTDLFERLPRSIIKLIL